MRKYASACIILISIFLAVQLSAQVESKTSGTKSTEKQTGTSSGEKAVPPVKSSKTGPTNASQQGTVSSSKSIKTGNMYDATGKLIYTYDQLGYIRNAKNRVFCQLTPKGEIIRKRVVVGTAVNGIFQDRFGKEYARIVQEGKIVDSKSKAVGAVKDDGTVIDKAGNKIGTAPGVDKNVVVLMYFYKDLLDPKATTSPAKK